MSTPVAGDLTQVDEISRVDEPTEGLRTYDRRWTAVTGETQTILFDARARGRWRAFPGLVMVAASSACAIWADDTEAGHFAL